MSEKRRGLSFQIIIFLVTMSTGILLSGACKDSCRTCYDPDQSEFDPHRYELNRYRLSDYDWHYYGLNRGYTKPARYNNRYCQNFNVPYRYNRHDSCPEYRNCSKHKRSRKYRHQGRYSQHADYDRRYNLGRYPYSRVRDGLIYDYMDGRARRSSRRHWRDREYLNDASDYDETYRQSLINYYRRAHHASEEEDDK